MGQTIDKDRVVAILEDIGALLDIKGENPFKVRAYLNAARTIDSYPGTLTRLIESGDLARIKGVGKSLAEKIIEISQTGKSTYLEDLRKELPAGLLDMLKIPGFGPKKAKAVFDCLGIKSVGELEYACQENRLVDLTGFGIKTQEKILLGIAFLKRGVGRFRIDIAEKAAIPIFEALKALPVVKRISFCGSIRRYRETIKDIDILVSSKHPGKVMDLFVSLPGISQVESHGETKSTVLLEPGMDCDLRIVTDEQFPYAQIYFTGSKEHNVDMRTRAKKKYDIKMNEYGLFKGAKETFIPCKDEAEIFAALKLDYIPPEMREANGEIETAESGSIPRLVEESDLKGLIHVHTRWSDGVVDVNDYIDYCSLRKWEYVAICDHSKSAGYAHGLDEKRVAEQHREIDNANKKSHKADVRVLKGIEADILPDGSLDYDDSILATFDMVIASIHSRFNMSETDMTRRVIKALKNKYVTMLGHPTGRLLLSRDGYPINLDEILNVCSAEGVMVEINAHPFRLDLDWRYIRKAGEMNVMMSINPDAHNLGDIDKIRYGVGIARKGWATPQHIFNTFPLEKALKILKRRTS